MSLEPFEKYEQTGEPILAYLRQAGMEVAHVFFELSKISPHKLGDQSEQFNDAWVMLQKASIILLRAGDDDVCSLRPTTDRNREGACT